MIEQVMIIIALLFGSVYVFLIASYCYGWIRTSTFNNVPAEPVFVSVLVPARNEENNILHCLKAITAQNYSPGHFEIIVVDDASADATNKSVQHFFENYKNGRLITLTDENGGKKSAIRSAIAIAKGELIITTDADCVMGNNWLNTVVSFYRHSGAKMIVGAVSFYKEQSVFEKMQSLEFMSLITCGAGSLHFNKAIMCNGANLAYTKQVFDEMNGFEGIDEKASGDDVLLMYKIKNAYPNGVQFLKNKDSIVYTKAKRTITEFIQQRKRWASKGFKFLNSETKFVSLVVYLFNFILLLLPLVGLFCLPNSAFRLAFFKISLILIGIKTFIDFLLLFLAVSFFNKRRFLIWFLPEQLIYIVYIVVVGLLGTTGTYTWKDRHTNGKKRR